jgi:NADPH2:quinone reductase
VSTKEKAAQAVEDGCHHIILYKDENFVDRVKAITNGKGVEVVYDSVGKDTFQVRFNHSENIRVVYNFPISS